MQQNDSFRLVVRRGPQPNHAFEISKDVTTLGRDISNDIVLNDRETSRHHLRLMLAGDTLTIEDLGSTNGTFVNGKRVSGVTPLQNGDMIGLGETVTLALESVNTASSAPPPAMEAPAPLPAPPVEPAMPAPEPNLTPPPAEYGLQGATPPPADPYAPAGEGFPPQQPAYPAYAEQPAAPAQQPQYYPQQQAGYQMSPAPPQGYPGYDYDPYAAREESGGTSPWLILGCFVFFILVIVCFAGIALTLIDVLNLWCDLPVVRDVVLALGFGC
ncbi:MAG: FHA domain-containing protein [Chloroflexota bacterium]|nr:FHA domain-containing protein [Chloroflexota bacterium]MDE2945681.1 FHA domain-containing protein [Chloroflexota bacterium]